MPKNLEKLRKKARQMRLMYGLAGVLAMPMASQSQEANVEGRKENKIENVSKYREVDYQVDTLAKGNQTAAYFNTKKQTITHNFFEENTSNFLMITEDNIAHEVKHRDNFVNQLGTYSMSLEQYFKCRIHDEISANLAALLNMRDRYIEKGKFGVKEELSPFKFYVDAVSKGKFNPRKQSKEEFMEEMSFIANNTQKMWMEQYYPCYEGTFVNWTLTFLQRAGFENTHPDEENYQKSMQICYNIGGVDFAALMSKDVECPNKSIKDADKLLAVQADELKYIDYILQKNENYETVDKSALSDFQGDMSLQQYYNLLWHQVVVNLSKDKVLKTSKMEEKEKIIDDVMMQVQYGWTNSYYKYVVDQKMQAAVGSCIRIPQEDDKNYQKRLDDVYTLKGENLRQKLECFKDILFTEKAEIVKDFEALSLWGRGVNYVKAKGTGFAKLLVFPQKNKNRQVFKNEAIEPKYEHWTPKNRVSEVLKTTIVDLKDTQLVPQNREEESIVEIPKRSLEMLSGMKVEMEETSADMFAAHYNLNWKDRHGLPHELRGLTFIDTDNTQSGILAVDKNNHAVMINMDGSLEEVSKSAGIKNVEACYWNNGVIMVEKIVDEENFSLLAVANTPGGFKAMKMGENVYDADENGKIVIYDENEQVVKTFSPLELVQKICKNAENQEKRISLQKINHQVK